MRRTMIAVAIGLALSQAALAQTQKFFGEDLGPGDDTRLADYPKSKEAYAKFLATLHKVDMFDFESLNGDSEYPLKQIAGQPAKFKGWKEYKLGKKNIKLDFGDNETAVLGGMTALQMWPNKSMTARGGFPTSGDMYVGLIGTAVRDSKAATIEFSEPQSAFGFYVTDIEKNKLQIELIRNGQKDEIIRFPLAASEKKPAPNGGICFVGVINTEQPFKKLRLINPGVGGEGFGFDDMMIAKPQHIKKIHLPPRFIVETYGVHGRGQRTEADPYFIGVASSQGKILQASPVEAWRNENGIKTITREELPGGFVALKTDAGYLPDLSQTIGAENTFEEMSPMYHEPGDSGFITLKVANSNPARYLRHGGYRLFNGKMQPGEEEKVFLQDVTWHFHEAPSETFSLADAKRILSGKWKANLEKTEDRFGRKPGLHDLLKDGFNVAFAKTSFQADMGGRKSSFSDTQLEGPKGDSHFILHATNQDGDKHDEDLQIVDEDHIVFLFQDGAAPIVFDRAETVTGSVATTSTPDYSQMEEDVKSRARDVTFAFGFGKPGSDFQSFDAVDDLDASGRKIRGTSTPIAVSKFYLAKQGMHDSNAVYVNRTPRKVKVSGVDVPPSSKRGFVVQPSHVQHIGTTGEYITKLKYTAPYAGNYSFKVSWKLIHPNANSVNASVFGPKAGSIQSLMNHRLEGRNDRKVWQDTLQLKKGDTVFIGVDRDTKGSSVGRGMAHQDDETVVQVQVTPK